MADEETPDIDPRLQFILGYLMRSMKFKIEKWQKMLVTEEYKKPINDFLGKSPVRMLIITLSTSGVLQAMSTFPSQCKNKSAYFIKKKLDEPVSDQNVEASIIYGDLCAKPIDQLAVLTEEVFVPMLSNPYVHKNWPSMVVTDVKKHVTDLKNSVNQVRGLLNGQTLLPMPDGVEKVEKRIIASKGEDVNLHLKSAIEGAVIKWATQINDVIQEQSSIAFNGGVNPTPNFEIQFWSNRLKNLESIYDQLRDERVKKMASILEHTDSAYFPCFKSVFKNVVGAVAEAREIHGYLKPLKQQMDKVEGADFNEMEPFLSPMMHTVCLVWANCKYYQVSSKIIVLMKEINNMLVELACKYLDPATIFEGEMSETLPKVTETIRTLKKFKLVFEYCRANLSSYFNCKNLGPEECPVLWHFHQKLIFQRYDAFIERLEVFFKTALEYGKLEKVEIGGLMGRILGGQVSEIYEEYVGCLNAFASISYDPSDPDDPSFLNDYAKFSDQILDMDRRLASALSLAFDDCNDLEHIAKFQFVLGSLLERPVVAGEITPKCSKIFRITKQEVETCQNIFDTQVEHYNETGYMIVDAYYPPVAGALTWIKRLSHRVLTIQQFNKVEENLESGDKIGEKLNDLLVCLSSLDKQLFEQWKADLPDTCEQCLNQPLFIVQPETHQLNVNFDKKLEAVLRELRYLNLLGRDDIPQEGKDLFERIEELNKFFVYLKLTVDWYNEIRKHSREEEFKLIEPEILAIDELIDDYAWDYICRIRDVVQVMSERVSKAKTNTERIRVLAETWNEKALFRRKGSATKPGLLNLDNQDELCNKRYQEIEEAGDEIHDLLWQNYKLYFHIEDSVHENMEEEQTMVEEKESVAPTAEQEEDDGGDNFDRDESVDLDMDKKSDEDDERKKLLKPPSDEPIDMDVYGAASEMGTGSPSLMGPLDDEYIQDLLTTDHVSLAPAPPYPTYKECSERLLGPPKRKKRRMMSPPVDSQAMVDADMPGDVMDEMENMDEYKTSMVFMPPQPRKSEIILMQLEEDPEKLENWLNYLDYIDSIILEGLLNAVGYSLVYITDEMCHTDFSNKAPLFRVSFSLEEPDLVFTPTLNFNDEAEEESLCSQLKEIIEDITDMGVKIKRVAKRTENTYKDDILEKCKVINEMIQLILCSVQGVCSKVVDYTAEFEQYSYLWLDDMQEVLDQFLTYGRTLNSDELDTMGKVGEDGLPLLKETPPNNDAFRQKIDQYEALYKTVNEIEESKVFDEWLLVDLKPFKYSLLNVVCKWSMLFKKHLMDSVINSLNELKDFIEEADKGLATPLHKGDYEALVKIITYLKKVRDRTPTTDNMFEPLAAIIQLLKLYDIEFPEETYLMLQELPDRWANTKKIATSVKTAAQPLIAAEASKIRKRVVLFDIRQSTYRENFKHKCFFKWECTDPYREIDKASTEMIEMEDVLNKLMEQAALFEINKPDFKALANARKDLKMAKLIWDYILVIQGWMLDWKETLWKKIDSEAMDMELKKFTKELRTLDKDLRNWDIFLQLESEIKNMIAALKAVTELQNPAIRDRHWEELMSVTKVKFSIDDSTTLKDLLDLELYKFEEEVKTIVDKSVKEQQMEKVLKDFDKVWSTLEFEYDIHARTKTPLLRCSEELIEMLEENQVQLQNMASSKFVGYFQKEVNEWQIKLSNADAVISIWIEVQRTWQHLESIFIGSDDIRQQLPEDSRRFDATDKAFRALAQDMHKTPNVVIGTNKPGLYEKLETIQKDLTKCEKALAQYLETKKLTYPRFYFVSSSDLLDILANGNNPEAVCKHLTKLYDSLAKLKFRPGKDGKINVKIAQGMYAKDGEYVEFNGDCDCSGQVENWLNNVTDSMRRTGIHCMSLAVAAYDENNINSFIRLRTG
ncbi:hypothetical protein M8J76_012600 [Diaphorina citri]|nr:hypothetical protein M8J76_012600 [Diaphorina citri]